MSSHEYSNGQQGQSSVSVSVDQEETTTAAPSPERDAYGGHTDVDLYNQVPTAYGTLYLLKDFGGNLHADNFDIDWMSTDLYSYTTVKAPLNPPDDSDSSQGGSVSISADIDEPEPDPSAVPSVFASMTGVGEFRTAEVATSQVIDDYLAFHGSDSTPRHPGLIIGASLVYTPGANNTTWEDAGLDETGVLYGIISLREESATVASMREGEEPFDWDAYDGQSQSPWSSGGWLGDISTDTLEHPYISYNTTFELPHLSYKFGYGDPENNQNDYSVDRISTFIEDLSALYVRELSQRIVADEIPNQIINNVIDYGTIKKSQLSSFGTTEALQSGIETITSTQEYGSS
jgi:hypothetical protein